MLNKVNYIPNETIITAENLNEIQDEVISNSQELSDIKNSISQLNNLLTNLNTAINNLGMTTGAQYVRFNNGLQICWGKASYPQLSTQTTGYTAVTFPVSFRDTNYQVATSMEVDAGNSWHVGIYAIQKATSYMNVYTRNGGTTLATPNGMWSYIAIGYWK